MEYTLDPVLDVLSKIAGPVFYLILTATQKGK